VLTLSCNVSQISEGKALKNKNLIFKINIIMKTKMSNYRSCFALAYVLLVAVLFVGCADSKKININGKDVIVEPYGWMNETEMKNDSVIYKVNTGNVVWSVIGLETVIVPIILTGNSLYEPVRKK